MHFSIIAIVAAFSSTALAQGLLDQIPKCAQTCFGGNLGNCGIADIACICSSKALDNVSCCVFATCSPSDIAASEQFGVQLCKLQNINVNTQPVCPSGSATMSGSAMPFGTSMPSGSSMPSAGNSASASMTGTASMAASRTGSPTSASAAGSAGAAPRQTAGAGVGLGIAIVGLLAAL